MRNEFLLMGELIMSEKINPNNEKKVEVFNRAREKTEFIDPRYLDQPYVRPGDGIDLSKNKMPIVTPYRAFKDFTSTSSEHIMALQSFRIRPQTSDPYAVSASFSSDTKGGLDVSPFTVTETTKFLGISEEKEEETALRLYFKGSYGLSSVSMAANTQKKWKETHQTVYSLMEHSGESERLEANAKDWDENEKKYM